MEISESCSTDYVTQESFSNEPPELTIPSALQAIASFAEIEDSSSKVCDLPNRCKLGLELYNETLTKVNLVATSHIILVDAKEQKLYLLENETEEKAYPVSTAEKGVGQIENTFQTPLGLHEVYEKIGDGYPERTIFRSRVAQLEPSLESDFQSNDILARILRLKGLEAGYNCGNNEQGQLVDSYERYIYIHGTNRTNELGEAKSVGCVRLSPQDVIDLFNRVALNTHVYIYA